MDVLREVFSLDTEALLRFTPRLLAALLVFFLFYVAGRVLGGGVQRLLRKTGRSRGIDTRARRVMTWIGALVGLISALNIVGLTTLATSLLATGGIAAVVFGFSFRTIGENLLAGIFLAFSRSFEVGDLIQSGGLQGKVKSIELRQVHIRTSEASDVFIPSAQIFASPLHNYTRDGIRRGGFTVGIDYRDDATRALGVIAGAMGKVPGVLESPSPAVLVAGLGPQYVELQAYFWIDAFKSAVSGPASPSEAVSPVRSAVMESVRVELAESGFTFSSEVSTALTVAPVDVHLPA